MPAEGLHSPCVRVRPTRRRARPRPRAAAMPACRHVQVRPTRCSGPAPGVTGRVCGQGPHLQDHHAGARLGWLQLRWLQQALGGAGARAARQQGWFISLPRAHTIVGSQWHGASGGGAAGAAQRARCSRTAGGGRGLRQRSFVTQARVTPTITMGTLPPHNHKVYCLYRRWWARSSRAAGPRTRRPRWRRRGGRGCAWWRRRSC